MRPTTATDLAPLLVEAPTYRAFLTEALALCKAHDPRFSVALLARRAGFASRSYPRDVLRGEKRITARSLPKFITGLKLEGEAAALFTLLVQKEEWDVRPAGLDASGIEAKLARARSKVAARASVHRETRSARRMFNIAEWPYLYAALGTAEHGASVAEVSGRTGMAAAACAKILGCMEREGVVRRDPVSERFHALSPHLIFGDYANGSGFGRFFQKASARAAEVARTRLGGEDRLFMTSVVSVSRADLPRLKAELKAVITRFIDGAETPMGDTVATVCVSLIDRARPDP